MPRLVRLYIASVATGFAAAAVFVALLLALDVGGLGHLVLGTRGGWIGGLMLFAFNGIVFAGVQFGVAVMRMAEPSGRGDGPPGAMRAALAVPVAAASGARRREPRRP